MEFRCNQPSNVSLTRSDLNVRQRGEDSDLQLFYYTKVYEANKVVERMRIDTEN